MTSRITPRDRRPFYDWWSRAKRESDLPTSSSLKRYSRSVVLTARAAKRRDLILGILDLPGIVLPGKRLYQDVFKLYTTTNLSFADAYHAVVARDLGLEAIMSFDKGFDRIAWLRRVEP